MASHSRRIAIHRDQYPDANSVADDISRFPHFAHQFIAISLSSGINNLMSRIHRFPPDYGRNEFFRHRSPSRITPCAPRTPDQPSSRTTLRSMPGWKVKSELSAFDRQTDLLQPGLHTADTVPFLLRHFRKELPVRISSSFWLPVQRAFIDNSDAPTGRLGRLPLMHHSSSS